MDPYSKKHKESSFRQKQDKKQKTDRKIHKGIFIADQRRKGNGGRIKSNSLPNKIEVRMKRGQIYLHESQVEWVEIARYNKKQGRTKRRQEKKQKFKEKEEKKTTKYMQKKQVRQQANQNKNSQKKQQIKDESKSDNLKKQEQQIIQKVQKMSIHERNGDDKKPKEQKIPQQKIQSKEQKEQKQEQKQRESDSSSDQSSQQLQKKQGQDQEKNQSNEQQFKIKKQNQEDDIVIVGEIIKQVSNPFWKKPFVGILRFVDKKNRKKQNYKQKAKSQICKILDDFNLDFEPIHMRLPQCYVIINNNTQQLLEKYVENNIKFEADLKGGAIRNKILDQLESMYALAEFYQNYNGNIDVQLKKLIGKARTIDGECNCFLYENELNDFQHSPLQQQKIPQIQLKVTPLHVEYKQLVFTIDPLTSTDLDDALSVRQVSEKQYQFGIHISDVSSYLQHIKRQEIARRTTSVYLPHYVFHMLPSYLVSISSLNPNVKRLAFSVFVTMNQQGQILKSRLQKNIIMSRYKLAYQQAESIITNEMTFQKFKALHDCTLQEYQLLVSKLKIMEKVGLAHRKKRLIMQIFDNDEIKFELNEEKWPISYSVTKRISSQKIIEQFMIIGNIESAKKSTAVDPVNSLIIHHPNPTDLSIRQFNQYFENINYKFKFQNSLQLQKDLLMVSQMADISEDVKKLCYFKARRVQETATYKRFSQVQNLSGNIHFALGLRHYTHFTSPMRRFADILVHEVLNSVVDSSIPKKELLNQEIQQANWGRKNTKRLKRDLNQVYLCLMIFKTKKLVETEAIIASFGCKSVSIFIPLFDMNRQIMWKDMEVDKVHKNRQDQKMVDVVIYYDKRSSKGDIIWVLEKFQKIRIKINHSNQIPLRLTFQLQVKTNKGIKVIKPKSYV